MNNINNLMKLGEIIYIIPARQSTKTPFLQRILDRWVEEVNKGEHDLSLEEILKQFCKDLNLHRLIYGTESLFDSKLSKDGNYKPVIFDMIDTAVEKIKEKRKKMRKKIEFTIHTDKPDKNGRIISQLKLYNNILHDSFKTYYEEFNDFLYESKYDRIAHYDYEYDIPKIKLNR